MKNWRLAIWIEKQRNFGEINELLLWLRDNATEINAKSDKESAQDVIKAYGYLRLIPSKETYNRLERSISNYRKDDS